MTIYDLRVTVERIEGRSVCGLEPGDYFEVTESSRVRIPPGRHFCLYALSAVIPLLPAKQRKLPDEDWLEQETFVACPDAEERLIMRIERIGRANDALRGPDLTFDEAPGGKREVSIAFQSDKRPDEYRELARLAERSGFDVVSVYNDLFFQPAIYPLLLMARGDGTGAARPGCVESLHAPPGRDRRPDRGPGRGLVRARVPGTRPGQLAGRARDRAAPPAHGDPRSGRSDPKAPRR